MKVDEVEQEYPLKEKMNNFVFKLETNLEENV
jgi:hypothetical protein